MPQFAVVANYTIYIGNQLGQRFGVISTFTDITINMRLNGPHTCFIHFPLKDGMGNEFNLNWLGEDHWIEVWRKSNDSTATMVGDAPFLIEYWELEETAQHGTVIGLRCYSAAVIMTWPNVAYASGTSQAKKTDYLDDMILEIADENLGASATDTDRDMSSYITTEAEASAAPSASKSFSRRRLSDILTGLCNLSAKNGTRLYWDVVLPSPSNVSTRTLELRTYTGQRGNARGNDVDNPLIFSIGRGNLESVKVGFSYEEAVNYAYGLGHGRYEMRNVQTASDTDRIDNSIWGRIKEGNRQASHTSNLDAEVQAEAEELIRERRPRQIVEAKITDTPGSRFGVHYNHGDLVLVEAFGKRYEAMLSPLTIRYANGQESIDFRARIETEL